jgi:autotransporter adhesin
MNKAYRVILNKTTGVWMAVAETAPGRGNSTQTRQVVMAAALLAGAATGGPMSAQAGVLTGWTGNSASSCSDAVDGSGYFSTVVGCYGTSGNNKAAVTALGSHAQVNANYAAAFGFNAYAGADGTVAVGTSSYASGQNSVALGSGSVADQADTVSIGRSATSPGTTPPSVTYTADGAYTRRLTNMSRGIADTDAVNVSQLKGVAAALGGGASVGSDGTISAPTYTLDNGTTTVNNVAAALSNIDTRTIANTNDISANTASINTLSTQINSGSVGLLQTDAKSGNLTIDKDGAGTAISVAGTNGVRTIAGVKAGTADTDAANFGQVKAVQTSVNTLSATASANATAVAKALGGGATVGSDGEITAPTYTLNNGATTVNSMADALGNLDTRTIANADSISTLTSQMNSGSVGLVQKDAEMGDLTIDKDGAGTRISVGGKDASGNAITRKLTNVTAGEADTDAANVGQLKSVDNKLAALQSSAVQYDDASKGTLTLNKGGSATQIKNVADGTDDADAVNLRQLKKAGMVSADGTVASVMTYDDDSKETATLRGANGTRLTNLVDGSIANGSKDAVTGSQLNASYQSVARALGGGAGFTNGVWTAPSYQFIGGEQYNNVGDALANLDTRVNTLEQGGQSGNMFDGHGDDTDMKTDASATGSNSTAAGPNSAASGTNSTAVGGNAQANATNSVSLGNNSVADRDNTVSVGSQGSERQITNVMAGTQDTDAVNVKQMNDKVAGVQKSVDTLQSQVNRRLDQIDSRMNRLGAMNAAMSTMVASAAGLKSDNALAVGTGLYRGQTALAVGYQRKIGSRLAITIGGSTAGGSEYNVGVGAGYGW